METVRNETSYAPVDKNVANGKLNTLPVGSCENGIGDSIPILILGNHRFQNFWKGTHVKIESEQNQ